MKKKVLVIGGAGFIGSNLSRHLIKNDMEVYCFDMSKPVHEIAGVNYICGDFFDDYTLEHALEGMDYVVHALSTVNPGNSNEKYLQGYERDFIQTTKLCKMITDQKIRMIFLSSGGTVYGNQEIQPIVEDALPRPINHYGNVKLCIENTIRTFNYQAHTKILIARISNPYGPGQDFNKGVGFIDAAIKKTIRGEKIEIWGDGNNVRDYIYIDDVCRMLISLFNYQGNYDTFNISSNTGTSQRDIIRMLEEMHLAPEVVYLPARSVDAKKIIIRNKEIMSIHEVPLVPIVQGIENYYQWLKKEIYVIFEFRNLIEYFLRNKIYMVSLIIAAVAGYGYEITHSSLGIDDVCIGLYFDDGLGVSIGRWSFYVINKLFHVTGFEPFIMEFAAVLILMFAAIVWSAVLRYILGD